MCFSHDWKKSTMIQSFCRTSWKGFGAVFPLVGEGVEEINSFFFEVAPFQSRCLLPPKNEAPLPPRINWKMNPPPLKNEGPFQEMIVRKKI